MNILRLLLIALVLSTLPACSLFKRDSKSSARMYDGDESPHIRMYDESESPGSPVGKE